MTAPLPVYYHPDFAAPIGEGHPMPIRKFGLVAEALRSEPALRIELREPEPLPEAALRRTHTEDYVDAVRTGRPLALAESQKFPWSPTLYPSVLLTNGGLLAAARAALDPGNTLGASAALVSGFHHAFADHGEGFCTFNGLAITADALHGEGRSGRVAVLDLDLHYGNGTASFCAERPYLRVLSIYGNDYDGNTPYREVAIRRHDDGPNHRSVALPNGSGMEHLGRTLDAELPWLLEAGVPDLLLYQAGADPYREDPYSPLELGLDDLRERDRRVFAWCRGHGVAVAWVLAGGYTRDVSKVVAAHVNTFRAFREVWPV